MIRKKETVRLFAKDITGDLVKDRQEVTINWRAGHLVLDEPSFNGGKDIGPDPFTAVLSGLVGCTLTTLRMYIQRKGWDITDIHCSVNMLQETEPFKTLIFRTLSFGQPWLSSAIALLDDVVSDVNKSGIDSSNIYFAGFSQGACLILEFVTRNARPWGGIAAFTGGLIGDKIYLENYQGDFAGTPVFIGTSDPDAHVPVERVNATTKLLKSMNARVTEKVYLNMEHTIIQPEIVLANKLIFK